MLGAPNVASVRMSGAAQALGAPKVSSVKAQAKTGGKPAGKPPGTGGKGKPAPGLPPPVHPGFQPKPPGAHQAAARPPARAPAPVSPLEMNPAQMQSYYTKQVGANTQAELAPYRQRQGEIGNVEKTVAGRYGAAAGITEGTLAGLQTQQAEGAKTYENNAADAALKVSKGIETAGQNAITRNGGAVDPQVQAALNAETARASSTGAAQTALAGQLGQNEANFMTNVRAAAAQRSLEGQRGIASHYGAERAKVGGEEARVMGRQPGEISKLLGEGLQRQFTDRATEAGLNIKGQTLAQKAQESQAKNAVTERGQNQSNARNAESNRQREAASQRTARTAGERNEISKLSAEDKRRYDEARVRIDEKTKGGKPPSPKEGRTYMAKLSTAESIARSVLGNEPRSKTAQARARAELTKKGASGDVAAAAMNLAVYGRLGPADRAAAESYGLTRQMRPQWFRTH